MKKRERVMRRIKGNKIGREIMKRERTSVRHGEVI